MWKVRSRWEVISSDA